MRVGLALGLALGACSSAPPPKQPAAPPPKCAKVADHMVELMPASQGATPEDLDSIRRVVNDHCRNDPWTTTVQDCLLAATTLEQVGACEPTMVQPPSPTSDAGVVDGAI